MFALTYLSLAVECSMLEHVDVTSELLTVHLLLIDHVLIETQREVRVFIELLLLFEFFEVLLNLSYLLFVHGYSLFNHVKGAWNDIKLWHNLFKCVSKLFRVANSWWWTALCVMMLLLIAIAVGLWSDHHCSWSICGFSSSYWVEWSFG